MAIRFPPGAHGAKRSYKQKLWSTVSWLIYFRLHTIHPVSAPFREPKSYKLIKEYNQAVDKLRAHTLEMYKKEVKKL